MKIKNRLALIILAISLQMAWIAAPAKAATFTVTSAADTGPGTLRWAIEQTNASLGADEIFFDDDYCIYPVTALPPLTDNSGATIDGGTHTVIIDAGQLITNSYGLKIASAHNIIRAIHIRNTKNIPYQGNGGGVWITGSYNLVYGCRIYNNEFAGISLGDSTNKDHAEYNKIQSCMIGTSDGITLGEGNGSAGIYVHNHNHTKIGVDGDGVNDEYEGNLISGNHGRGIYTGIGSDMVIAGNLIGTDITGTLALPNAGIAGIVSTGENSIIGTNGDGISDALERNVISGNSTSGVAMGLGGRFSGNFVGVDITGTKLLANTGNGISIMNHNDTLIGTDGNGVSDELERNIISGNTGDGISCALHSRTTPVAIRIAGNYIGTDAFGTSAIHNGQNGINIINSYSPLLPEFNDFIIGTNSDGISDSIEANVINSKLSSISYNCERDGGEA